jgi:hypothetical protein
MPREIRTENDRQDPTALILPQDIYEEEFAADYTRDCEVCEQTPVVNATGLCGPCTFGESDTKDGNW